MAARIATAQRRRAARDAWQRDHIERRRVGKARLHTQKLARLDRATTEESGAVAMETVRWALYQAPVDDEYDRLILVALADQAAKDGTVALAPGKLAARLGRDAGAVRDALGRLHKAGLVRFDKHGQVVGLVTSRVRSRAA